MKALVLDDRVHLAEVPPPEPRAGEATVRVTLSGICNTDLELARGYMGFRGVLGHEFVGVVERSPDPAWMGRRVVADINLACGACEACARGEGHHCPRRTVLGILNKDGAHAERVTLPLANLYAVPASVPDEAAVFAEPVAAAAEILDQVPIAPEDEVAVLGDGKLGLLIAQVLATTGCRLTAVGKHREKLAILAARGIRTRAVGEAGGLRPRVVVEATGNPEGFRMAMEIVRPRGVVVLKSTYHGDIAWSPAPLIINEVTLVGSRCGPFDKALALLAEGKVSTAPLVSKTYDGADAEAAFAAAGERGAVKVLLRWS